MERSHNRLSDARCYRELLFYASVILLLFILGVAKADDQSKPANFDEIRKSLEAYAKSDDLMDERLLAARESLRAKSDEAFPALMLLFKDSADDQYRAAIIDVFRYSRDKRSAVAVFLEQQLAGNVERWEGKAWVAKAIACIAAADPHQGRSIALKALDAKADYVLQSAIKTLGEVGTKEELDELQSFRTRRLSAKGNPRDGMLSLIDDAVKRIEERLSSPK